jgi:hypothetical protein
MFAQPDYEDERRRTRNQALGSWLGLVASMQKQQETPADQLAKLMLAEKLGTLQQQNARRNELLGGSSQPPVGAIPPQYSVPQFGQLNPDQLMRQNQMNGIQSPDQMVLKSLNQNFVTGDTSAIYGQSPQAEADMSVKTQLRKDVLGRMGKLQELIPLLDNFEAQLDSIPVGKGVGGKFQGMAAEAKGMLNADPFAAASMSQLDALRPQIARAFGDVGNLSQTEQQTARKFMPDVSDSADTRAVKIVSGLTFLKRKLETSANDAGLRNSPEYQQKFSALDERIKSSLRRALESGVSGSRLKEFAGKDVIKALGIKSFKNESEFSKAGIKLNNGDIVEVGGKLAVWEE